MNRRILSAAVVCWACALIGCGRTTPTSSHPDSPAPANPVERPKTVDELIATINDNPDGRHFDVTPSVEALIELGHPVLPRVLDLMLSPGTASRQQQVMTLSDDDATRMRAQRVLEGITAKDFGCKQPGGWARADYERWRAFWKSLGDLQWDAPQEDRRKCVRKWKDWLASRDKA
ncbi:MAG TPA: hypothetical protein VKE74_03690 [Gemmataceae bacterium]|nr:hypothetical protein [Gemmataceae bacterium]